MSALTDRVPISDTSEVAFTISTAALTQGSMRRTAAGSYWRICNRRPIDLAASGCPWGREDTARTTRPHVRQRIPMPRPSSRTHHLPTQHGRAVNTAKMTMSTGTPRNNVGINARDETHQNGPDDRAPPITPMTVPMARAKRYFEGDQHPEQLPREAFSTVSHRTYHDSRVRRSTARRARQWYRENQVDGAGGEPD